LNGNAMREIEIEWDTSADDANLLSWNINTVRIQKHESFIRRLVEK
jgi:hypothetical protein